MGAQASMGLAEPALEGRIFTSLGFQPQVGWWPRLARRVPHRRGAHLPPPGV